MYPQLIGTAVDNASVQAESESGKKSDCGKDVAKLTSLAWNFIGGSTSQPYASNSGTRGVTSNANLPNARSGPNVWGVANRYLYYFGGNSAVGYGDLNDLWRFDTQTGQWVWLKGVTSINNMGSYGSRTVETSSSAPQHRAAATTWNSKDGYLYLFSGYAANGNLNDMWRYNPISNNWTWMAGPNTLNAAPVYGSKGVPAAGNLPPTRLLASSWTEDNGDLWMFGGSSDGSYANDLWKFDHASYQWAWLAGSGSTLQAGIYGTRGEASAANIPGSREVGCTAQLNDNEALVFGGKGFGDDINGAAGLLNDLWRVNAKTKQWTYLSGDKMRNGSGVYGAQGVPAATNKPGARRTVSCWLDSEKRLWLFGGAGLDEGVTVGELNDLWVYDLTTDYWTWMGGSKSHDQSGVYGVRSTYSFNYVPGSRGSATTQVIGSQLYLFSGRGFSVSGSTEGVLNDLWQIPVP